MNSISILLCETFAGQGDFDWQCGENGDYVLTVEPDILINLREDDLNSQVCMYASPGYLRGTPAPSGRDAPEPVALAGLESLPEASLEFRYSPGTALTLLVLSVDRAALRAPNFSTALFEFIEIYRTWQAALPEEPDSVEEDEDAPLDEPVSRFDLV